MKARTGLFSLALVAAAAVTTTAEAHTGGAATTGLAHGLAHPFGGLDHLLAMISIGVFAFLAGGRAVWLVPATFVAMMAAGGAIGIAGIGLPFVEVGIALSVVVTGALVALGRKLPIAGAMALVGIFAVLHGHAHGAEMPAAAAATSYGTGFVIATALLHAAGLAAAWGASRLLNTGAVRLAGAAVAAAGVALLGGAA